MKVPFEQVATGLAVEHRTAYAVDESDLGAAPASIDTCITAAEKGDSVNVPTPQCGDKRETSNHVSQDGNPAGLPPATCDV